MKKIDIKKATIKLKDEYTIKPNLSFQSTVVRSGNGAVIKAFKKFIGCNCTVIVHKKDTSKAAQKEQLLDDLDSASSTGWENIDKKNNRRKRK